MRYQQIKATRPWSLRWSTQDWNSPYLWSRPRIVTVLKKKNNGEPTSHSFRNQSLTRNITISWIKDPVSNRASDKLQNWENYIQKNRQPRIHLIITHHFPSLFRHFSITFPSLFLVILWRYCWYVHGTWHLRPRRHGRSRSPRSPDTRLDPKRRERSLSRCRSCRRGDVWCPCHRCHDR